MRHDQAASGRLAVATSTISASTSELRWRGVNHAIAAMQRRLGEAISLRDLAKTAAMSQFHFDRVFRQLTGVSPFQYLSAIRLAKATDLLLTTNISVTEVCLTVGYSSLGTFTRRFVSAVGASPRRVRYVGRGRDCGPSHREPPPCAVESHDVTLRLGGDLEGRLVLVGAFPTPLPMGRPTACVLATDAGPATLGSLPAGRHHILAAALPHRDPLAGWMAGDIRVAAAARPILLPDDMNAEVTLELRALAPSDPPILTFLPLMLREHEQAS